MNPDIFHIDYETYSPIDLSETGPFPYAEHPDAEILMMSISKNDGPTYLWVNPKYRVDGMMSDPEADELLLEAVTSPDALIYAHNAMFELAVSKYRMRKDIGLIPPPTAKWRCTMALCRKAGLPASLDDIASTLGVENKDSAGTVLINRFCKPNSKTGARKLPPLTGQVNPDELVQAWNSFGNYCRTDNRVEKQVFNKLRPFDLRGINLDTYLLDQTINLRGIPVNTSALKNAKAVMDAVENSTAAEYFKLTGLRATQRDKNLKWFNAHGLPLPNLQAATIETYANFSESDMRAFIEKGLLAAGITDPEVIVDKVDKCLRALNLYSYLQFAAVKKVDALLRCACSDGFVRGSLLYHGAGTGRWSAKLIQIQNFKKPTINLARTPKGARQNTEIAYDLIQSGSADVDNLQMLFGAPALEVIASCIRHFIHWREGQFLNADFNAIEARLVLWLAGQEDILDLFRNGGDLYKRMASEIFGIPESEIAKESKERDLGKKTVLGCGYGMGVDKFFDTCIRDGLNITHEQAEKAVNAYRRMCSKVKDFWYSCDKAARNAILTPGKVFPVGRVSFRVVQAAGIPFLVLTLPSGRGLYYPYPLIEADDDGGRDQITFWGQLPQSTRWGRIKTYGGKLVENATQGAAADVMACGAAEAERQGYEIVALIHDEALSLFKPQLGQTVDGLCKALCTMPPWANGLPLKAEGKALPFFKK